MDYIKQETTPVKAEQITNDMYQGEQTQPIARWLLRVVMERRVELIHPENPNKFRIRDNENAGWISGNIGDYLVYYPATGYITIIDKITFERDYRPTATASPRSTDLGGKK